MAKRKTVVAGQLRKWAEDLVDLTRSNRLLYFSHTQTSSFEFSQSAVDIERGFAKHSTWGFHLPPEDDDHEASVEALPLVDELVVAPSLKRSRAKIERGLRNLARDARSTFLDTGIWVLYLGLGSLEWIDVDNKPVRSPLLLLPVELRKVGTKGTFRLGLADDAEAALNPALAVKLERDFGLQLPSLDDLEEPDLEHVMEVVAGVVPKEWRFQSAAVLRTFTFHKLAIYRDLLDNADVIAEHDMVRLLAEGPTGDLAEQFSFVPDDEETIDERHPPEELACVLDADASQRQCLIAARGGHSFVMDGPPGTGKSQTIANVIAQLLADGKTILFVSEKAAALEVVQSRLAALKLDPFLLTLHSKNAGRKAVAQELGRALDERPSARARFDGTQRARLRQRRTELSAYASAVNETRYPLERSLHDAIGRIAQLADLPSVPVPEVELSSLNPNTVATLIDAAGRLGRSWGPVERGSSFVWRDLKQASAGSAREADLRRRVDRASEALGALRIVATNIASELRLPQPNTRGSLDEILGLLELVEQRPAIGEAWLGTSQPDVTNQAMDRLIEDLGAAAAWRDDLGYLSAGWPALDRAVSVDLARADEAFVAIKPRAELPGAMSSEELHAHAKRLEKAALVLERIGPDIDVIASAFGLKSSVSLELAGRLAELGQLAGSPHAPEPLWLNPVAKKALDEARRVLTELLATYRSRRESLKGVFNEHVLDLDLQTLKTRFEDVHSGMHRLSSAYRTDKATLAAATASGKFSKEALARLDEAIEWQDLAARLGQAEERHAPRLGSTYYSSRASADLDAIERAVLVADRALVLAAGDVNPDALAEQIGLGGSPDARLPQACGTVLAALHELRSDLLQESSIPTGKLESIGWPKVQVWLAAQAAGVQDLAEILGQANQSLGDDVTLGALRSISAGRAELEAVETRVTKLIDHHRTELGGLADAPSPRTIQSARDWVAAAQAALGGPIKSRVATALLRTQLRARELRDPLSAHDKALSALLGEFQAEHEAELRAEADGSFEDAEQLLLALGSTLGDISEWQSYIEARTELLGYGWEPTISACELQRVAADDVAALVERTVLSSWADQIVDGDPRLQPRRAVDREELLAEFRRLDAELVADTAAAVINACAARRPRSLVGGAGIIRQQAELKRRHKPVRKLLELAGETVQDLKPCFMMSPLSVSQFLPPALRFDAVIFDEASQVREADAICSIYRGSQVIVAGDQKQLPPTDFFTRSTDGDDETDDDEDLHDFESVLDRSKAQGVTSLPLNWHYRSRHESLITFSNRSFYSGRLHTFPGATFEATDLGVELFHVDGTYHRGGTRDNPIEAAAVVDRVVQHRKRHPDMTLGVVALSAAQQSAIEYEIERRSRRETVLRDMVTDDRLDGFFVKNLENVQGDERDLIILSVGYGPDENGKLTMNFGPMNREGGERRLNVAVTRARRRVEVVSSVRPGEITSDKPSIRHLARYLDYADRGVAALSIDLTDSAGDAESPFEEEVLSSIAAMGFDPAPQVGVAGYRVDIGVRHPTRPGSYTLGVECDGATYHSSKVARDRDRLRQQVLEGLGWTVHRIWSTAWFTDRPGEEARLRTAIEASLHEAPKAAPPPTPSLEVDVVVDSFDFDEFPSWAFEYQAPQLTVPAPRGGEFTDPGSRPVIASQIQDVVATFGPIHEGVVLDLVRVAWGLGRSGSRIRDAFRSALGTLLTRGEVAAAGEFLSIPGDEIYVRVPTGRAEQARRVSQVPPAELDLAIIQLLDDAGVCNAGDLRVAWARLFGWKRVGSDIDDAFEDAVDRLMHAGMIAGPDPLRPVSGLADRGV